VSPFSLTDHVYFTALVDREQLDKDAVDRINSGDDAIMLVYEGPMMDRDGVSESLVTRTVTAPTDDVPRKVVNWSVNV
jgi:hypothetical protein